MCSATIEAERACGAAVAMPKHLKIELLRRRIALESMRRMAQCESADASRSGGLPVFATRGDENGGGMTEGIIIR